jgi:hypothetical protein
MTVAESFFLTVLTEYLDGVDLTPAPAIIGVAEPEKNTELPAIVLSLETTARVNPGLGERAQLIVGGILPWQADIDLANPFIDGDTTFPLVDGTRRQLILPHGGLVRADGSDPGNTPLAPADITVKVDNVSRTVVAGAPGANQVRADGSIGLLTFGDALPPTGTVSVTYVLGQWEQRLERIAGTLRVDICAADVGDAETLSDAVVTALLDPAARRSVRRLIALSPTSLGSISQPESSPKLRRRTARMTFSFEREINRPDSSGGIIRRIDATSRMGDGLDPPGIVPQSSEPFTIPA